MNPKGAFEAVDALVGSMDDDERAKLFEHLRGTHPQELGRTAMDGAAQTPESPSQPESNVWHQLSPERQETARAAITAMAEKFGVKEDDFVLLTTSEADKPSFNVVYSGNGLDLGNPSKDYDAKRSWDSIFDEKRTKEFTVKVNGQELDTRAGMTEKAYRALAQDARERKVALPDSKQMAKEHNDIMTWTWESGSPEKADRGSAPIVFVRAGGVGQIWNDRDFGYRSVRFRPAVVIE